MATFSLTKGNDTFDLDTAGTVSKGGTAFGKWSTNATNQVVVTKSDGTTIPLDVDWTFNHDNHLVLQANGADVFDFSGVGSPRPFYKTENAILQVFPDQNKAFSFQLRGEWDLDTNHNLAITINNVK